jgi:phosphoglycolate phosphatase-like HAD superfamily hydrolase
MLDSYQPLRTPDGQAWAKAPSLQYLRNVDAAIFDCDGVLIDASKSYTETILRVADLAVQKLLGRKLPWRKLGPSTILQLHRTGMFNNDWDTTYAIIMLATLALSKAGSTEAKIQRIIKEFTESVNDHEAPAYESVNEYLRRSETKSKSSQDSSIAKMQRKLEYPGSPPRSFMTTLFDEIYYGPKLYAQIHGPAARYYRGEGLIERERVLVSRASLDSLVTLLGIGRLAIATGRPFLPTKHVLGSLLSYFKRDASIFLGDKDIHPELASQLSPFRKPSGKALVYASRALSSNRLLYVGDSAEDIMMVENARSEISALSVGVYGTSIDEANEMRFFRSRGVDLIIPTARSLSTILRSLKK